LNSEAAKVQEAIRSKEHANAVELEAQKKVMESLYGEEQKEEHAIDAEEKDIEHKEAVRQNVHGHLVKEELAVQADIDKEIVLKKEELAVALLAAKNGGKK
jgi:hypothetical protein